MNEKPLPMVVTPIGNGTWTTTINLDIREAEEDWICDSITASLDHAPQRADVVKMVNDHINAKTDEKILSGFVWRDNPVWLSSENQFNFKAAYDIAVQTGGMNLPARYKLGEDSEGNPVYYDFNDLPTFQDFYLGCVEWIQKCIATGWEEKDSIDYDEIMKPNQ